MRVRATKTGFYGTKRLYKGDEFILHSDKLFSENWMEAIDGKAPKKKEVEVEAVAVSEPEVSSEDDVI